MGINKIFKSSFMFKLSLTYSAITIIVLWGLLYFIKGSLSDVIYNNEKRFEDQIVSRVTQYMDSSMKSSKDIIQRIYLSSSDSSISIFNVLQDNGETVNFSSLTEQDKFNKLFSSQLANKNNIMDIIIYKSINQQVVSYSKNIRRINNEYDFYKYSWFNSLLENKGNLKIISSYLPEYIPNTNEYVYSAVTSLYDFRNNTISGVMIINMDTRQIFDSYSTYQKDIKGFILVMDKAGNVIYDSSNKYMGEKYPYFHKLKNSSDYLMLEEESMVSLDTSSKEGFVVAGIVSKDQVLKSINSVLKTIYIILFISLFFSIILIGFASRLFSTKVQKVMKAMKEVEHGNLKVRVQVNKGLDEIEQIAHGFNKMCDRLSTNIEQAYLYEIKNKEAELSALQYQINPHFLYNTLESIRMEAIINNDHDVGDMIYALAYLFRTNVKNVDRFVKLQDEMAYTKSYLDIFKIRYKDRLKITMNVDEAVLNYAIPKLTLQPIVENCIIHGGIDNAMEVLTIDISAHLEDHQVKISIMDNGLGIDEKTIELLKEQFSEQSDTRTNGHVGLKNVNDRFKIIFGETYGLSITSGIGQYTKFVITIPKKHIEEMNMRG